MADCGINGTTIDRTVQSVLGSANPYFGAAAAASTKGVTAAAAKSLLGHATQQYQPPQQLQQQQQQFPMTGGGGVAMPVAPPQKLTLSMDTNTVHYEDVVTAPSFQSTTTKHPRPQQVRPPCSSREATASAAIHEQMYPHSTLMGMPSPQHMPSAAIMANQFYPPQQHAQQQQMMMNNNNNNMNMQSMAMTMMMQQQQLAQMVHHNNQQQQQLQQRQNQQQRAQTPVRNNTNQAASGTSHAEHAQETTNSASLLNDRNQDWQNGMTATSTSTSTTDANHPGEPPLDSQTMEQLAAAWAEAEAELAQELWNTDASQVLEALSRPPNEELFSTWRTTTNESLLQPYEFLYPVDTSTTATTSHPQQEQQLADHDWMDQGMRYFRQGEIKQAIHAFEQELQKQPTANSSDNSQAWRMLGRCYAEHDQDRQAIICLEHAVDRDPYSTDALLDLGVSYVNELNHEKALQTLLSWITHNPQYQGIAEEDEAAPLFVQHDGMELPIGEDLYGEDRPTTTTTTNAPSSMNAFEKVQKLLLRALEYDPTSASVMQALGVVYNVSGDYNAAVDMFEKALHSKNHERPPHTNDNNENDRTMSTTMAYQLWNQLGATLANSHRSEQALSAYARALQAKPKFARGWLNLAISHSNLHNYHEAARCYLQTLSLNPAAVHCWSYLRIALTCDERFDLLPLLTSSTSSSSMAATTTTTGNTIEQDTQSILRAFQEHYDFVVYDPGS